MQSRVRSSAPSIQAPVDTPTEVPGQVRRTASIVLAAPRNDRIEAPCLFDGPINGERFHPYVEQFIVPTLKPGDVVILDNLGSHKGKAVRRAIRDVGARLVFLPKYSPDLNPIEQVFAKFKTLLRKAGARSTKLSPKPALTSSRNTRPQNAPPTSATQGMRNPKAGGSSKVLRLD
jgi:transposase